MATHETHELTGKRIPTYIAFQGDDLPKGGGKIYLETVLRTQQGDLLPKNYNTPITKELSEWQSSEGVTGKQVLNYLGEWFDAFLGGDFDQKEADDGTTE